MVEVYDTSPSPQPVKRLAWFGMLIVVFLCMVTLAAAVAGWLLLERAECGTGNYTMRDELRIKTYASGVFRAPEWTETYSAQPFHVTRAWLSETYHAVVFVDYLLI